MKPTDSGPSVVSADSTPSPWLPRIALLVTAATIDPTRDAVVNARDFHADLFTAGPDMLVACGAHPPACAVIDSRVDDIHVPSAVRALVTRSAIPVFVGVWEDDTSKETGVEALQAGARGLVVLPVTDKDLSAALVQSGGRGNAGLTALEVGSLVAFEESREVYIRGVRVHLPEVEFRLLWRLLRSFPQTVNFDELMQGDGTYPPVKKEALKARASRLRRKLDSAVPGAGAAVVAVPATGYAAAEFH